jgi:hypothetical protein
VEGKMIDLVESGVGMTIGHAAQALGMPAAELAAKVDAGLVRKHPLPHGCRCVKLDEVKEDLGLVQPALEKPNPKDMWSALSRHQVEGRDPPSVTQNPGSELAWMRESLTAHRQRDERGIEHCAEKLRLLGWALTKIEPIIDGDPHEFAPDDTVTIWTATWGDRALVLCDAMDVAHRRQDRERSAVCSRELQRLGWRLERVAVDYAEVALANLPAMNPADAEGCDTPIPGVCGPTGLAKANQERRLRERTARSAPAAEPPRAAPRLPTKDEIIAIVEPELRRRGWLPPDEIEALCRAVVKEEVERLKPQLTGEIGAAVGGELRSILQRTILAAEGAEPDPAAELELAAS